MGRVVDITEKLELDENPKLKVKDQELEVQADAATVLKIMGLFKSKSEEEASLGAYELLFTKEDRKKIDDLKISFKNLAKIISVAIDLAIGNEEEEEPGEE